MRAKTWSSTDVSQCIQLVLMADGLNAGASFGLVAPYVLSRYRFPGDISMFMFSVLALTG